MDPTIELLLEDSELINKYNEAPKKLEEAVFGLNDMELDKKRAEGKWSIREITHHIVECDLNYFQINRYALANTGEKYIFNGFDSHTWNNNMGHQTRPIQAEILLFKMTREYITYLCNSLPDALDRVIVHQNGKATVRDV